MQNASSRKTRWNILEVPDSFWKLMSKAQGSEERMTECLQDLSEPELFDVYNQYMDLKEQLFDDEHLEVISPEYDEDDLIDLAHWVVAQGKELYFDLLHNPEHVTKYLHVPPIGLVPTIRAVYVDRFGLLKA